MILNIFLEITSKHICPYYFFQKRYLTRVNREKPIRRRNSVNISLFELSSSVKHGNLTINSLRYRTISGFHEHEQNTNMQSCDDYVKCKISLDLLCCSSRLEFKETKVLSSTYPQYSLRNYESDVTEWLPRRPENLKQAVKYEGCLLRKSVH